MPAVNRQALFQLSVLLLVVPTQYLVTRFFSATDSVSRNLAFSRLLNSAAGFHNKYLSLSTWKEWCQNILSMLGTSDGGQDDFAHGDDPEGQSPAVELLQPEDIEKRGYFASSTEPRVHRPGDVKFHIGQVVHHKEWKYRGVIVGWDHRPKAPKSWIELNHPKDEKHLQEMPHYAILVDTRDSLAPQLSYDPQENLEVIVNSQVIHPYIDNFFEFFDGGQYIPRPWLQAIYPED